MREHGIKPVLDIALPQGVTVQKREDERNVFYFLQNYDDAAHMVEPVSYTHLDVYKRQSPTSACAGWARPWTA